MSKKNTNTGTITDLILVLNSQRNSKNLPPVRRCWTGAGHWLLEPTPEKGEGEYRNMGGIFVSDDRFIGFLEGLTFNHKGI